MAYENLIAKCIVRADRDYEPNEDAGIWADSLVEAELAGFLHDEVDVADHEAVAGEVFFHVRGLEDMNIADPDDPLDRLTHMKKHGDKEEKQAARLAIGKLNEIKKAAKKKQIDENKVLKLVLEDLAEIAGD